MGEKEYYINQMKEVHPSKEVVNRVLKYYQVTGKRRTFILTSNHKKQIGAVIACATILLAFFAVPGSLDKVAAYCQLAVYNINQMIYGAHEDVSGYTTNIVQNDTNGNLSIQLNEALLDGDHLIVNYTVTSAEPRFHFVNDTYEGYYDIALEEIAVNGVKKKYSEEEMLKNIIGFSETVDEYSYIVEAEYCLNGLTDVLEDRNDKLDIEIQLRAWDMETEEIKHFSYAFMIHNRELEEKTKVVPMAQTLELDGIRFSFDKMKINAYSQKVYFHVEGLPDYEFRQSAEGGDSPYFFSLEGTDNNGNKVFAGIPEIIDGYGYFDLISYSNETGLDCDVEYYDFQLEYIWTDPDYIVCDDEHEGEFHGREGAVGEPFRINCK